MEVVLLPPPHNSYYSLPQNKAFAFWYFYFLFPFLLLFFKKYFTIQYISGTLSFKTLYL